MKFAPFIEAMPSANVPFAGVETRLLAGLNHQAVFFRLDKGVVIPPHSHCAQWGVVLEGELDLTICGETKRYTKGDTYIIPLDGVHSAVAITDVTVIDVFDSGDRYKPA